MHTPADRKTACSGFTLVEMLVVITIIGILVGFTAVYLGPVRVAARNAAINVEIDQLEMSLENYKNEYDDYPPTFIDVNLVAELGDTVPNRDRQNDARNAVIRHLRRAFPRYVPGRIRNALPSPNPDGLPNVADGTGDTFDEFANDVYYYNMHPQPFTGTPTIDPRGFDPASALVFWLGGLPEAPPGAGGQWIPAGFHSDPEMPFKPGTPRNQPLFDYDPERIAVGEHHCTIPWDSTTAPDPSMDPPNRFLRYYPDHVDAPYVYFRARRRGANWQYCVEWDPEPKPVPYAYYHAIVNGNLDNICVAYRDPQTPPYWREHEKYQIIAAGLDGQFGTLPPRIPPDDPSGGVAQHRVTKTAVNFSEADFDNLANFCTAATLEKEIE